MKLWQLFCPLTFKKVRMCFLKSGGGKKKEKGKKNPFILLGVQHLKLFTIFPQKYLAPSDIVPIMTWKVLRAGQRLRAYGESLSKPKKHCVCKSWTRWEWSSVLRWWFCKRLVLLENLRVVGQKNCFQRWPFIECDRKWCCLEPLKITANNSCAHSTEWVCVCMYAFMSMCSAFHCSKGTLGGSSGGWKWECFIFLIFCMAFVILMWNKGAVKSRHVIFLMLSLPIKISIKLTCQLGF